MNTLDGEFKRTRNVPGGAVCQELASSVATRCRGISFWLGTVGTARVAPTAGAMGVCTWGHVAPHNQTNSRVHALIRATWILRIDAVSTLAGATFAFRAPERRSPTPKSMCARVRMYVCEAAA